MASLLPDVILLKMHFQEQSKALGTRQIEY